MDKSDVYGVIDIGIQTDEDVIIDNLKNYVASLTQRIKMLERELRMKDEVIVSLSNGNAYLQQQSNSQLDLIRKLTPNIDKLNGYSNNLPNDYTKLKASLMEAEDKIRLKERFIKSLTNHKPTTSRNRSETKDLSGKADKNRKRNQESSVGELLRWSIPNRHSSIPPITCKITERSFDFSREEDIIAQDIETIEKELTKEIEEKEKLEEKYNALKYLVSSLAQTKKRILENEIKIREEKIREMKNEIKCFKAYHGI